MDFDLAVVAVFGFPLVIVALGLLYAAFHRYLQHRERIAMIEKGILPDDWEKEKLPRKAAENSTSPVVITLVGVAVTLGLLTIGIGPWLIGGLVPTAYGCALLLKQMRDEKKPRDESEIDPKGE